MYNDSGDKDALKIQAGKIPCPHPFKSLLWDKVPLLSKTCIETMYITSLSLLIVKVQKGQGPQVIFQYCKGYGPSKSEGQCPFTYPGTR